jgi:hypothetical protein
MAPKRKRIKTETVPASDSKSTDHDAKSTGTSETATGRFKTAMKEFLALTQNYIKTTNGPRISNKRVDKICDAMETVKTVIVSFVEEHRSLQYRLAEYQKSIGMIKKLRSSAGDRFDWILEKHGWCKVCCGPDGLCNCCTKCHCVVCECDVSAPATAPVSASASAMSDK